MIIRLEESIKAEDEVVVASGMRGIEPVDSEAFVEEWLARVENQKDEIPKNMNAWCHTTEPPPVTKHTSSICMHKSHTFFTAVIRIFPIIQNLVIVLVFQIQVRSNEPFLRFFV